MLQSLVEIQSVIYQTIASHIRTFAESGDWGALILFMPAGIAFGAVHALTPGHSKTVLATYLAGSSAGAARAFATATILAATHIASALAIALLSLPLVSRALSDPGSAPVMEAVSRLALGAFGVWMIWRSVRAQPAPDRHHTGTAFGIAAGLVPCPLTLFVMTFAGARNVPEAGLLFAGAMFLGVGAVLAAVAVTTVLLRARLATILARHGNRADRIARACEALGGLILLLVAGTAVLRP